jgi:hypothetical protein
MILESMTVDPTEFEARTGWAIKPEGACKGDVCVPLHFGRNSAGEAPAGGIDATALADRLGMPLVADEAHGIWALGPETAVTGRALTTAVAPDITLPQLDGSLVRIADLRPQKVVVVSWASW